MNPSAVHQAAIDWAQSHLALMSRSGDDRLWDRQGRSYKVRGRTGAWDRLYTSFDLPRNHGVFDYLVGVVVDPMGHVIRVCQVDQATFRRLAHVNEGSVRFRLSDRGPEAAAVYWLIGP